MSPFVVGFSVSLVHKHTQSQTIWPSLIVRAQVETGRTLEGRNATLRTSSVLWTNGSSCDPRLWTLCSPFFHLCVNLPATFPVDLWIDPISSCHFDTGKSNRRGGVCRVTGVLPGAHCSWLAMPDWCGSLCLRHPVLCFLPLSSTLPSFTSDFFTLSWRGMDLILALSCL